MLNIAHHEGCLICGRELEYRNEPVHGQCSYCGKQTDTLIICPDNHFVCDDCHRGDGLKVIENICLTSNSTDPVELANQIMNISFIHMHGPEHHALVPAVITAAYKNKTGLLSNKNIQEAIHRGSQVQGGMCGNFGACGAGIGTGIALSVINGTTPLSLTDWSYANQMTAQALNDIAKKGGPRCCKRCTWSAIESAVNFIKENLKKDLDISETAGKCTHYHRNKQCQGNKCSYFPKIKRGV